MAVLSIAREINTSLAHGSLVTLVTTGQSRKRRTLLTEHSLCADLCGATTPGILFGSHWPGRQVLLCHIPDETPQLWEGARLI